VFPTDDEYEPENNFTSTSRIDENSSQNDQNSAQETENIENRKDLSENNTSVNQSTSNTEGLGSSVNKERTKEETDIPISNDKIIDESDKPIDVQNNSKNTGDNLSIGISDKEDDQKSISNLNEQRNNIPTVNVKEDENVEVLKQENSSHSNVQPAADQSENNRTKANIDENLQRDDQKAVIDQETSDQEMKNRKDLSEDDTIVNQSTSNTESLKGSGDKERTKEETDIPIGNDKIINEPDESIDVQNNSTNISDNLLGDIPAKDEQQSTSNSNEQRNYNVKEAENVETIKRERPSLPPATDQYELSNQSENNRTKASHNDQNIIVNQENSDQKTDNTENRKDLSELFGDDNSTNQSVTVQYTQNTLDYDDKERNLSSFSGKLHEFDSDSKSVHDTKSKKKSKKTDYDVDCDDDIGEFSDKKDKKEKLESYHREQSDPKSDHDTKSRKSKKSDTNVNYDYDVGYNDDIPNKKDNFPSSTGNNRTNEKEKLETYHREQSDKITRHPKYQDSQGQPLYGGLPDEEAENPISKSRNNVRKQTKSDDESDNDENVDYDSNEDKNDDNEESNFSSRANKKDVEPYYEESENTRHSKNKNNQNLPMHGKKPNNMSDSQEDENDDYEKDDESYSEEHSSKPTRRSKNKNNQNTPMHGDIDPHDKNDDYEKDDEPYSEEHSSKPTRRSKNKNNQNTPMHGDIDPHDENDDYEKDDEPYSEEHSSKPTRRSKNKNNQNTPMHGGIDPHDENDDYEKDDESYSEEHSSKPTRRSKNKNNQNIPMHGDIDPHDENDDYEKDDESYSEEHSTSKPIRHSKHKNNRIRSTHDNASDYEDENYSDSQKDDLQSSEHNLANKRKESEESESYGAPKDEINPRHHKSQSDNRDNNNSQGKKRWMSNMSNAFNRLIGKGSGEVKVVFHVHFPEDIENAGKPVVLGNVKELGYWKTPTIKFRKLNHTYWRSEPVTISLSESESDEIQYKYAIHISRYYGNGEIIFEGNDDRDNRTLNIERNDQFDIFINNYQFQLRYIRDFAFVDYIFNSIKDNNLKDKVMEYQQLLNRHYDLTIRTTNFEFIANRVDGRLSRDKLLFLCLLLGYYISGRQGSFYDLQNKFPSETLLNALYDYKQETLPSNTKDQMYTAIITLVVHNASLMKFDWLAIFTIASEVDPNFSFIDRLKSLKYNNDDLKKFIQGFELIKPYIDGIEHETYIKFAKVNFNIIFVFENLQLIF
jgi:hypothetical protein